VPLVVGQERVVFIDRNVRVGVPAGVGEQRVQSAGGAIYLRASEPIPPTRLQLQDVESGALILLDIAAEPAKDGQPRWSRCASSRRSAGDALRRPASGADDDAQRPHRRPRETPVAVVLTRYAAQNLYAPLRTVEPSPASAASTCAAASRWTPCCRRCRCARGAGRVAAGRPVGDGRALTNTSGRWLDLDPRALQGDFLAATFQHPNLGPAGTAADTTVVYLVTRGHGLAESLLPALAPIDATVNLPPAAAAGQAEGGARHEK
jgi:integrating conjugative element protein (TIGR03749 family)